MDKPYLAERAFRLCRRCGRYRSIGNFSVNQNYRNGHTCHLCWKPGVPNANRAGYVLTDKGRAALAQMAKAS
jgi:hypothetical protein